MKYEIVDGRCVATRDFGDVSKGDVGGFVEPGCLSQEGNCWVDDNARAFGNVSGDAIVRDNAFVIGNVSGKARVSGTAEVFGRARVFGRAKVFGEAVVFGNVYGRAKVFGKARVSGTARVSGNARVSGKAEVTGIANSGDIDRDLSGQAIVISDLEWLVTVTDNHIKIGCACKSKKWWSEASDEEITELDYYALAFWKDNKTRILGLCK